ncbi:hypothetical protein M406DRAFT_62088 [Cryphonectria parasitica EP155]|uniref:Uncharacterized protein n=1 Tax=Cryphonectria parasitica (strain ATCC 38755 / EP155) TaxID=660469 RepID=A0A9P4Y0R0_CRYP1|nr:uncharacterized protein M406DRAFT_62088 [Cryphonectria parasitica EP155]KAF3764859.1 hypothetical protein M406DRAFT_62088 [Cryphonectria parasitica EP155]
MGSEPAGDGGVPDAGRSQQNDEALRQSDGDSFATRLGRSAAGLSRSVLQSTPTASDLAGVASSGKSGPSTSPAATNVGFPAENSSSTGASTSRGAFRPGHADTHVAAEEAAFSEFLDSTNVFVPTEPVGLAGAWETSGAGVSQYPGNRSSRDVITSSVAEQQERDGVEVVRLLSQVDEETPEDEAQMRLTEAELKKLRQALFEDGSPAQISASDWNNMLNFVPDFLREPNGNSEGVGAAESSFTTLGVTDLAEAGQLWLEDWNRVLTGYTDEVWGDLGDIVQEARTEVQQIKDDQATQKPDPTALRRLQSTLRRVRAKL